MRIYTWTHPVRRWRSPTVLGTLALSTAAAMGMTGLASGWIGAGGAPTADPDADSPAKIAGAGQPETGPFVRPTDEPASVTEPSIDATDETGEIRWFNNRPIRPVRTISMLVTAYSPDERSCGKWADGITASGYSVRTNGMKLVAADTSILPFGSLVSVPGYDAGDVVPVLDRGGKIKGNRLDVLYPTHEEALVWGVQRLEVTVWEYADGEPDGFRTNHRRR